MPKLTAQAESTTPYNNVTNNISYSKALDPLDGGKTVDNRVAATTPAVIACVAVISLLTFIIVVLAVIIALMRLQTNKQINETR